jgi:hypothetical protein
MNLNLPIRRAIAKYLRRMFQREQGRIKLAFVSLGTANRDGNVAYTCRIGLWSSWLGPITVTDEADTIITAIQRAGLRARQVVRRRLHKRRSVSRRWANRFPRDLWNRADNAKKEIET